MYKCGNINAFVEATTEGAMALDESTDDAILTVRNQNMAKRIDEILQAEQGEERMMFAVGVAHWIIGDQSLEVLLKEKGYKTKAKNFKSQVRILLYKNEKGLFKKTGPGKFSHA